MLLIGYSMVTSLVLTARVGNVRDARLNTCDSACAAQKNYPGWKNQASLPLFLLSYGADKNYTLSFFPLLFPFFVFLKNGISPKP